MRILLASNASYAPPRGGSTRSNLVWLAHLARSGHTCRVISAALSSAETSDVETVSPSGVSILSVRDLSRRTGVLAEQIRDFHPDWCLCLPRTWATCCCGRRTTQRLTA